ncbi:MAG: hypothetical protein JO216_17920 [Hyphomicrobiales bacterium]|nr:hypothetical protein [Hyphomicrobiales bacterium]
MEEARLRRKIAVIMAADVSGYSRLVAEDEDGTLKRLMDYREIFTDFVSRGHGRIFASAHDIIRRALQLCAELAACREKGSGMGCVISAIGPFTVRPKS